MMQNKVVINTSSLTEEEVQDFEKNLKIALLLSNPDNLLFELELMLGELTNSEEENDRLQFIKPSLLSMDDEIMAKSHSIEIVDNIIVNIEMKFNPKTGFVSYHIDSVDVGLDDTVYHVDFSNSCFNLVGSELIGVYHPINEFIENIIELKEIDISEYFTGINPVDYIIEQVLEYSEYGN